MLAAGFLLIAASAYSARTATYTRLSARCFPGVDVDHTCRRIRALRDRACDSAQQLDARYRVGGEIAKRPKVTEASAINDNHWRIGISHVDRASAATRFDSTWPSVSILVKIVAASAGTQKIPGVGESGVCDFFGAERLGSRGRF